MFLTYLAILSIILGVITGISGVYQIIKSFQRGRSGNAGFIILVVVGLCLFLAPLFLLQQTVSGGVSATPTPSQGSITQASTNSSTVNTITPTPTTMPTQPPSGTILYNENGSDNWQGWAKLDPWKIVFSQGLLANTGGVDDSSLSAIAPYHLNGIQNFAIEVKMRFPRGDWDGGGGNPTASVGIICKSAQGEYRGQIDYAYNTLGGYDNIYSGVFLPNDKNEMSINSPGNSWQTYRLEVRGYNVSLLINNVPIAQATDTTFIQCGDQIGLYSQKMTVEVSNFSVIAL